jgi:hypothetical protein
MSKIKSYFKENVYFLCGMFCLFAANIPSLYGALAYGETAPLGFLILLQLGLTFYLLDAIFKARPKIFVVSGVINTTLNFVVLTIALIN